MYPGATAVVCIVQQNEEGRFLYTANVGDSRALLSRGGNAVALTVDHKPEDEAEAKVSNVVVQLQVVH